MNILAERRSKFRQELIPIIYVSIFQIWLNFNFPAFIRLGSPWNSIISLIMSIACIIIYIFIFSYADTYASYVNLEYLDEAQNPSTLKNIERGGLLIVAHIGLFFAWHKNLYSMADMLYVLCYVHCFIAFILLYRAVNRKPYQRA
jgi:hypothetical protein